MNADFEYGMKVSLGGEFGVVVKSELDKPDFYGRICWDTEKEFDFEDWHGLFGSFINQGGKIIDKNYQFRYISEDGSKKACL
ncbi:MAG TPA: hypothetical protein VFS71_13695 [Flavobacterium sp.]|uniref:hypothetical protein n=1 Tax=Flavobacterium sp. TaxID=239 RepID=UPI002DB87552|nr:hypothetical protein [Flavobacterium sp.]HEU4790734.1 hypothetical protein [Flavobacterium sp.]